MGRSRSGVRAISGSSIEITFAYRGVRCRERVRLKPTPANLKRAARHRAAVLDAIERNTFDYATTFPDSARRLLFLDRPGEAVGLTTYLDGWLTRMEAHLKRSTWDDYRKIINHTIIPALGETLVAELKRPAIRDWLSGVAASNKRLANIQSVLRSALQDAVNDGVIEANPLYGWKYERKEAVKRDDDVDPFSSEEQTAILDALSGQKRNLIQFALWTGLRTSELCALEWGDIDWRRGTVRVQRAKTQASDEAETTKTRSGVRDVKLLGPALEALQAQKLHTLMKSGALFENPRTGEAWIGDQPIRHGAWVPAMRKAGVRYRRPYQTRHTYASMMLSAGESPMWVAQQMGHSDWTMIARIYGRWIPEAAPDAGQKAVKIFGQNAGKNAGITAANAGKLMPASELSTDKNQVLNGGEGGIRTRVRF